MKKKLMAIALCTIIGVMAIAGSSLAWLQDSTQTVVNTFTEGKVDIDLYETKDGTQVMANSYKMVPGDVLPKDPTVEVLANSEACWLLVKVEETANVDTFLTYAIADGWKLYNTEATGADINTVENDVYVIYREVDETTAKAGETYSVLADDVVTVNEGVTMGDMETLKTNGNPQLKFTAYAVQSANVADVVAAWALFN